ncbi:alpha/beta hydrolase [Marinicrinis sediminis]|uniref:Alpha/beta hydrolase n=1 Tax=Marinicrinis sediminis TaxID=1652465 RepID=A0ABW5RFY1_9BACL
MDDAKYYKRTIVKEQIYSHTLDQERSLRIFLPPGYEELNSYPVIYCQDGEEFFNFGRIATHATKMILDEGMEPFVIVGVDVNLPQRTEEYAPDGQRYEAYRHFFAHEMLPYVEENYAVRNTAAERILAGDSLGGTVSLHLVLDHPELFTKVISLSGAFLPSTQKRLQLESDLSHLHMYMLIGTEEEAVQTDRGTFDFLALNRTCQTLLEERNARLHYTEKPGRHLWGFWQNEIPEALAFFYRDDTAL